MTDRAAPFYIDDQRPDPQGNVTLTLGLPEFEAFIGLLNSCAVITQRDGVGPYYALKFLPHYMGHGPAALEISERQIDVCDAGFVCEKHLYDAPGHGGCDGAPMPCGGSLHSIEEPPPGG